MNPSFYAEQLVDLHNDTGFNKLASFATEGYLTKEDMEVDLGALLEKQAYAEDATYADDLNRMFSIASPIETKLSALYAIKCASLLDETTVNRINNACKVYEINLEVPVVNKVATVMDDPELLKIAADFDKSWVDEEELAMLTPVNKYASTTEYGTELDTCLAARAYYATEPEDVEAIMDLAKLASAIPPEDMVNVLHDIDSHMGLDTPAMQARVGSPEYAVYEKVASENMVNLGSVRAPLSIISEYQDEIKDLGVDIDWDGDSSDSITLQLERLPQEIKSEIGSWVK